MSCNHAGFCLHLARGAAPIWHCEEFDDSAPATSRPAASAEASPTEAARAVSMTQKASTAPQQAPRGLCENCKNLPTCRLAKCEAGVWHCEEYL